MKQTVGAISVVACVCYFSAGLSQGQTTRVDLSRQSRGLPSATGQSDGKIMTTASGQAVWQTVGGDVSGSPGNLQVQRIQGRQVSATAPSSGNVLRWNSSSSLWEPGAAAQGDLTAGLGIVISGSTVALNDAVVPMYSTGASVPSSACMAGRDTHLDTSTGFLYFCSAGNAWRAVGLASLTGTYSALTSTACGTGNAGQIAVPNDSVYGYLRCNGTGTWEAFGEGKKFTAPPATGWSWVNQGTANETTSGGIRTLTAPAAGAVALRLSVRSVPATPYTATVQVHPAVMGAANQCGLVFYETGTQRSMTFGPSVNASSVAGLGVIYYPTTTSQDPSVQHVVGTLGTSSRAWLRMQDDGTMLIFSASADGLTWVEIHRESRTARFTTAPDRIGYACNAAHASIPATMGISHWVVQ